MKCSDMQERIFEYWDLPVDDSFRMEIDAHVKHCASCAEQLQIWSESKELIELSGQWDPFASVDDSYITQSVMNRIYKEDNWRMPVVERNYSLSYQLRRRFAVLISSFVLIFVASFVFSILPVNSLGSLQEGAQRPSGVIPVASAVGDSQDSSNLFGKVIQGVPVASISDPFVLNMGPIRTYPDYLLVLSLFGIIFSLLIMNWFSRIRV